MWRKDRTAFAVYFFITIITAQRWRWSTFRSLYLIQSDRWAEQKAAIDVIIRRLIQSAPRCFRWCRRDWPSYPGGCCWRGFCAARPARAYRPPSRIKPVSFDHPLSSCPKRDVTNYVPYGIFFVERTRVREESESVRFFTIVGSLLSHYHYFCMVSWKFTRANSTFDERFSTFSIKC